ncbi:MAG: oligoendopeptidase F [Acidobacteria bacterium SCN 69-37]|nr:MAG: oligoendopeptidase F [Acidobacteria bacterium SCN 69-37]
MLSRAASRFWLMAPAFAALTLQGAVAQERDRADVPDQYKWDLTAIYPSNDAWRSAKTRIEAGLPELKRFEGRLGSSATVLADAMDAIYGAQKELYRAYGYASLLADQDTREASSEAMRQEMVQIAAAFGAQVAYVEPEILGFAQGTVQRFVTAEPRLAPYRFYLEDIARRAPHTLSPGEEKILADVGPLAGSPSDVYNILSNADFPYPVVTLSDGTEVRITQANYGLYRASANRRDRESVMSAFFGALGSFGRTLGTTMNGSVQKALFFAKARHHDSSLESTLNGPNIPVSVYTRLVDGVNRHLPSFHRYLQLRKRMLGVDELHYYDLYAPLVSSVELTYTPDEAIGHIKAAMAPLGTEYVSVLDRAFKERWIDMFPTPGKRSGAYSQDAAFDVHPYMLMNYNGKYDDMSTLAHELGHTMQSYLSSRTQPYPMADYPTFVAEVASTFNESLLVDHMLTTLKDDDVRLSLLGSYLENIKGTVFRQTQFAEFELAMHEMAQKGQPITGAALDELYMGITKKYYGHDAGVTVVDDYVAHEWSYIPHFYRDFYVFQYATSFTASEALAQRVKAGEAGAVQRYLAFLSAGGSKYPIDLLRDAGVDMTTDEPLDLTIREMDRVMDEMEALLARR